MAFALTVAKSSIQIIGKEFMAMKRKNKGVQIFAPPGYLSPSMIMVVTVPGS
jgi:hypothetical protein